MTVRSGKYDNYKVTLLEGGVDEAEVNSAIADMEAIDAKIDALICPSCGSKITRTLDPRQAGPTAVVGVWFNYNCVSKRVCGWFVDRCEPVGEN